MCECKDARTLSEWDVLTGLVGVAFKVQILEQEARQRKPGQVPAKLEIGVIGWFELRGFQYHIDLISKRGEVWKEDGSYFLISSPLKAKLIFFFLIM